MIRFFAKKPYIILPIIRSNVTETTETVVEPIMPRYSRIVTNKPDVPWPHIIGIDPVQRSSSGFRLKSDERVTPKIFGIITNSIERIRNVITFISISFNSLILTVNPILVKNVVINIFWSVVYKFIVKISVIFNISINITNTKSPTTDGEIQYFDSIENLFLKGLTM